MTSQIVEASSRHPKPDKVFSYGTAGVRLPSSIITARSSIAKFAVTVPYESVNTTPQPPSHPSVNR